MQDGPYDSSHSTEVLSVAKTVSVWDAAKALHFAARGGWVRGWDGNSGGSE